MSNARVLSVAISMIIVCGAASAGGGSLDPTFNEPAGFIEISFDVPGSTFADTPATIARHTDGSFYVGGTVATASFVDNQAMAKLTANGQFDAAFGYWISNDTTETKAHALVLTSPGPCLVGRGLPAGAFDSHGVVRCGAGGLLAHTALMESGWFAATSIARSTALGDVFEVAGYRGSSDAPEFEVKRFVRTAQGLVSDPDFGVDGSSIVPFGSSVHAAYSLIRAPDNGIYAAGYTHIAGTPSDLNFAIAKLTEGGDLDPAFSLDGMTTASFGFDAPKIDYATALALDPSGRIVVAGVASNDPGNGADEVALLRLLSDGSPDPGFGIDGKRVYSFTPQSPFNEDYVAGLAIDSKNRIYVVGSVYVYANEPGNVLDIAVMRLLPNGEVDVSFGTEGRALFDFSPDNLSQSQNDYGVAIVMDGDKPVILAESQGAAEDTDFVVFRLLPDDRLFADGFEQL